MQKYEIECIEVVEPDGGGMHDVHVAYVSNGTLAQQLIDASRNWPRRQRPYKQTITVFDSIDEMEIAARDRDRISGLSKLTDAEKKALGL